MANFVKVCKAGDVKPAAARVSTINGKAIGVFNVDGKFYAINDVCGHRGGPLGEGELDGSHGDLSLAWLERRGLDRFDVERPGNAAQHQNRRIGQLPLAAHHQYQARLCRQFPTPVTFWAGMQPRRIDRQARTAGVMPVRDGFESSVILRRERASLEG